MSFSTLGIPDYLIKVLDRLSIGKPYPIQEKAIPQILQSKDILGIAPTGSGKTLAYALPTIINLADNKAQSNRNVNTLILVPTRELAIQVQEVFHQLNSNIPFAFKSLAVYGGVSINPQMKALYKVNVLIATPGRLLELVNLKAVNLSEVDSLIIDEADKMLNLGFSKEMNEIFTFLPKKRQNMLFSATLSPEVEKIEQLILNHPITIDVQAEKDSIDNIQQTAYKVSAEKKGPLLRYLIQKHQMSQVLVFTSSVYQADLVANKLSKNGIDAAAIHSKKSQGYRKDALQSFKNGKLKVLVATDLLSRGIDIEYLPYVINYELPRSPKDFIHRIGRTGRANQSGEAITIITEEDTHHFRVIQKKMKKWVTMVDANHLKF